MRYSNDIDNVMTELREEAEAHGRERIRRPASDKCDLR